MINKTKKEKLIKLKIWNAVGGKWRLLSTLPDVCLDRLRLVNRKKFKNIKTRLSE